MKRRKTSNGGPKKKRRSRTQSKSIMTTGRLQTSISQGISVIPDRIYVKLRWGDMYNRAPASAIEDYIIVGNGAGIPDANFPNHQPTGWDQWSLFYGRYRVRASAITVHFINVAGPPAFSCILPNTAVNAYGIISESIEAPRSKLSKWMATQSRTQTTLKAYASTSEVDGVAPQVIEYDDTYSSQTASNPANRWYWHIITAASTGNVAYSMLIKVTYYLELYERISLGGS